MVMSYEQLFLLNVHIHLLIILDGRCNGWHLAFNGAIGTNRITI